MTTCEHTRRMDPFRHLDAHERRSHLERYERFLAERDGAQDFENRTLSLRDISRVASGTGSGDGISSADNGTAAPSSFRSQTL